MTDYPPFVGPKTIVDFLDAQIDGVHKAKRININGQPVRVEAAACVVDFSPNTPTRVRLTLLPDEVHFRHDGNEAS